MAKNNKDEVSAVERDATKSPLESFLQEMNTAAGRTVAYIPANSNGAFDVKRVSSGVLAIDIAIGGGYPLGRNIYFVGPKSTCKSTLLYLAMSNFTNKGLVYLEDAENTFDNNYATKLGVDTSKMLAVRSRTAEEAFNHYRCATAGGDFKAVFLDSIAALQPEKLVDGTNSDSVMGGIGRITSVNMANLEKDKFHCNEKTKFMPTLFYTNQIRKKVGLVFGSPQTEPGGESPDFYASIRLDLSPGERIEEEGVVIGGKFNFLVSKNKTFPAWRTGEFYMRNDGVSPPYISNEWTLMEMAVKAGVIDKSGSWYSYLGNKLGQGAMNVLKVIQEFPLDKKNEMLALCVETLFPTMKVEFKFQEVTNETVAITE